MGFIGLNVALRFVEVGERVVITQHSAHRVPDVLKEKVGSVVNLMAPPARSVPTQSAYHLYTAGLENVLQAAQTFGLRRVSLGSSVSVYAGLAVGPFREDLPLPIASPTQVSAFKKAMEIHALHWAAQAKLDVVALRIASVYGPLYYSMFNPVSRMCAAAVANREPDFSDRPGGRIFADDEADWTHVSDVARGIQMVHAAATLPHRAYNIGSGRATSNRDVFEAVRKVAPGARCAALTPGRSPGNATNPATDLARIKTDVGYEPVFPLEAGIAAYVDWLRTQPQ